ncbi:cytochrome P450 [Paenibacillus bovis]|uniref:Cytochrome n=1 Tax=Paenibacillus bovis TaxID=1616788 RepID=A0A172ZEP9_9BACL|nr:cytochrome P450 [Paenibacillus bovis]ANF96124.1 cytochrome [Paenibacillus bovis]
MTNDNSIPRDHTLEGGIGLLSEGYEFAMKRRQEFQSNIFQTRMLGQKAICIGGKEGAELFYNEELFQRGGAIPKRIQKSLFGEKGVQTLDGQAHMHRKKLFMSLMSPERLNEIAGLVQQQWEAAALKWQSTDQLVLFDEAQQVMCRAACQWAGVPLQESDVKQVADDLGDMVESFGAVGMRHRRGRQARRRTEQWIGHLIEQIREGKLEAPEQTAAHAMSWHRDTEGNLLDTQTAAVELINIIRPIVAIGRYVVFSAVALHHYPDARHKLVQSLQTDDHTYSQWFVQEVRRFYPFTPILGAQVRKDFTWNDYSFEEGTMVLLDVYGTTHDEDLWQQPDTFRPERFEHWSGSPFDLIPQGGGDHYRNHRCAGEWLTIDVMRVSLEFLTTRITYDVPEQDLTIDLSRMPAIPESRFIMSHVQVQPSATGQ